MLKKSTGIVATLIKSVIGCALFFCVSSKGSEAKLLDKVIATVNQEVILYSELEEVYAQSMLQGSKGDTTKDKIQLLAELIIRKLYLAEAISQDVKINEEGNQRIEYQCSRYINHLREQAGSQEKLSQLVDQPIYRIKEQCKQHLEEEMIIDQVKRNLIQDITVTPAEIKTYFNNLPSHKRPYYPTSFEVRQLVVYPKITLERKAQVRKKLEVLKEKLLKDATVTFAKLAKEHSKDAYTATKGGDMGWMPIGMGIVDPAYEAAALSLKPGEVSDPIESGVGFHLIWLVDKNKAQYHTHHILYTLKPTQAEMGVAKVVLDQIRVEVLNGILSMEEAIQKYSEDKESIGGLITSGNLMQGTLCSSEALDPTVYFAIEGLKEGEMTQPQCFTDMQRKLGWRLLYLKRRLDAHSMNLAQDYDKIYHYLLKKKQEAKLQAWFQTTKSKFTFYIDPAYQSVEALL